MCYGPSSQRLKTDLLPNEMHFINCLEVAFQIPATFSGRQSQSDHLLSMQSILPLDDDFANVGPTTFSLHRICDCFLILPPLSKLGACRDVVLMTRF